MAGTTPNLGLYLPGGGSTGTWTPDEVADIDTINQNFVLLDAAVGDPDEQNRQWYGPAAQIGTLPDSPKDGDTYQESDGSKILWKRVGGVWVTGEGGAYLLRPTTLTNCVVAADGSVTPNSGVGTISFEFSSLTRFRTVELVFHIEPTAAANPQLKFRRSGADLVAATSYKNQRLRSNGATVTADYVTNAYIDLGAAAQAVTAGRLTVYNAGESSIKPWTATLYQGATNPHTVQLSGLKDDAEIVNPLTGFTIVFPATTFLNTAKNYVKTYGLA